MNRRGNIIRLFAVAIVFFLSIVTVGNANIKIKDGANAIYDIIGNNISGEYQKNCKTNTDIDTLLDTCKTKKTVLPVSNNFDITNREKIAYGDIQTTIQGTWNSRGWAIETVDSIGWVGLHTSLALDSNDRPHISYYCEHLKYAMWTGSTWAIETVDNTGIHIGAYTSLALDSNDRPHISYLDYDNDDLKYAVWTGSTWSIETVDSNGNVGMYSSLSLDSNGYPHISYFDNSNNDLKYAVWTGSTWSIETVDSDGIVGLYNSLALDSNDYPHISYHDEDNFDLKYAVWTGSTWSIETVDGNGNVGWYTSLALDSNDYPHICYLDYDNYDLKYAVWTGSSWNINTIDNSDIECETSLALDSNGYPHISYYDAFSGDLKYAVWMGSNWIIETVDSIGYVGMYSSLALDNNENPHISYYDETNSDLKYAKKTNQGPDSPIINGPTSGSAGIPYTYTFTSIDPNGDNVSYYIKWGDGSTTDWTAFQASGTPYSENHTWSVQGTYKIEAKAKNTNGAESDWSYLEVTMPKNKMLHNPLMLRFFERFPNAFSILRYLLGL